MPGRGWQRRAAAVLVSTVALSTPLLAGPLTTASAAAAADHGAAVTVDVTRIVDGRPVTATVTAADAVAAEALAAQLENRRDVLAADLSVEYRPATQDPLLADSVHLHAAQAPRAWARTVGAGTVVAVLDTGTLAGHPDLQGALLPEINAVPTRYEGDPGAIGFHGTLVSSIVAARLGNGLGTAGVAPGASVLPVRVCAPGCSSAAVTVGIDRAVSAGATVINMSIAGPTYSRVIDEAVQRAVAAGVVVVASAGNDGAPCTGAPTSGCGNPVMYPAAYPNVISVSAATPAGGAAAWAVHNDRVDLSAVGERVLGAVPPRAGVFDGSEYAMGTGTSFAAPQVAAAAALVKSVAPHLSPAAVEEVLTSTAVPAAWPAGYGRGLLDVAAAVAVAAPGSAPQAPAPPSPVPAPTAPVVSPQPDGSVHYGRSGSTHVVKGAILARYRAAGAERGALGWPLSGEVPVRGGALTRFEHGSVYWSPATGAQVVKGAVRDRWGALGWESSPLGFPTGEEVPLRGGVVQHFAGGLVHWSPATGAHDVRGAILGAYGAAGWETGVLGYPVTGETPLPGGAFNHFQHGSIYWSPAGRAQVVRGAIRDAWAGQGWERGRLGFPVSGERPVHGGVRQDFQGGSATYSWTTRRVTTLWR